VLWHVCLLRIFYRFENTTFQFTFRSQYNEGNCACSCVGIYQPKGLGVFFGGDHISQHFAGHLPHSELEFRRAETKTPASQLEAHLQAAPVERLQEHCDIVQQPVRQIAVRGPRQYPRRYQPKRWRWNGLGTNVQGWHEDFPVPRGDCCRPWTHTH
jgi:hypothetical protein